MPGRPKIPAEMVRDVLLESGHRCAICGIPFPIELAHIIPWRKSKKHKTEDLICLCANCHKLADHGKWTQKTLREFKQKPWVVRQYKNANNVARPTNEVELSINLELQDFDEKNERWLQYALAAFLNIPPNDVRITSIKEGNSVRVTVELPSDSAANLLAAHDRMDAKLVKYIDAITLFNLYGGVSEQMDVEYERELVRLLPGVVSRKSLRKIAESASDSIRRSGLPLDCIVAAPPGMRTMAAIRFAQAVTKQMFGSPVVILECSLPEHGYVSWLLLHPLGIAFDRSQVLAGAQANGQNAPRDDMQIARAIIHELGHIITTPRLFHRPRKRVEKDGRTFTAPTTALEEERAWVWAMFVFGIAMAHHSRRHRKAASNDDTISLPL